MNLHVYTAAPSLAQSVATSAADLAALVAASADPLDSDNAQTLARISATLPELALGDGVALNVYFYDAAGVLAPWSGAVGHTVTAGLGFFDTNGSQLLTSTTLTATTNGFTGTLSLNTPDLIQRVRAAVTGGYGQGRWFESTTSGKIFPFHLRHVDNNVNYQTCAIFPQMVRDRVLANAPADSDPQPSSTYLTVAQAQAMFLARAAGYAAASNASGTTNVAPASTVCAHTQIVNFSGATNTTRVVALATAGRTAGDTLALRANLPTTAGITVEVRNGTAAGTLLASFQSDGTGDDATLDFYFDDAGAWQRLRTVFPA